MKLWKIIDDKHEQEKRRGQCGWPRREISDYFTKKPLDSSELTKGTRVPVVHAVQEEVKVNDNSISLEYEGSGTFLVTGVTRISHETYSPEWLGRDRKTALSVAVEEEIKNLTDKEKKEVQKRAENKAEFQSKVAALKKLI